MRSQSDRTFPDYSRYLLIAYALVNAVLYSVLLPLWEGFDEPFHFAYVQQLANWQGLPDARTSRLSGEVAASIRLAPASDSVKQNLAQVTTYEEYFSLPTRERLELRRKLRAIPAELRWQSSEFLNYEGHQAPLAYLLLAWPERLLARVSLPTRVASLRIVAAVAGSLFLLLGAERLFVQLGIGDPYRSMALFCLLSSQMMWATLAHVANDWLAVPIALWTLVALIALASNPSGRTASLASLCLAAGLLTKAYFLALIPLLIGMCALRKRWRELAIVSLILCGLASPWYLRNIVKYGVLTGTQEARAGIGLTAVLRNAPAIHWPSVIWSSVRTALWTGNNTFSTFSANTLSFMMGALTVALLLWATSRQARRKRISDAESFTIWYCVLFALALGYAAVVSHIYSHGAAEGPSPWYAQVLLGPLLGLAFLGVSRRRRIGRFVAAVLVLVFGYVLAATYAVKLIPLYGGFEGRTTLAGVAMLYSHRLGILAANLDAVTLAPAAAIFVLAGVVIALVAAQQILLVVRVMRTR
ncbi:MAG: hypothetical protein JOZ32_08755 [Bryobacterales bacterium]|nr:hypothetical protein [Bryobacterales bacterium]